MNRSDQNGTSVANVDRTAVMNEYDAARYLGVCTKTLRKLRQAGEIPHARIGNRICYLQAQLYAWLAAGGTQNKKGAA